VKKQLTTALAVFAATSVLFLGIGAAIAATSTLGKFAPGSSTAVSCAAGSARLSNTLVRTESETVNCPLPTTTTTTTNTSATTTTVAPTTTTTATPGSWSCTSSVPNYLANSLTTAVSSVTDQGGASTGAVIVTTSGGPNPGTFIDGNPVTDATTPSAIPSGTTVVSLVGTTLTLSKGVTTIAPGDVLDQGGDEYWTTSGCPIYPTTWIDNTNFVGQNNPASNSGSTVALSQDVWSPICTNSSGAIISYTPPSHGGTSDPTCVDRETQTLQANSAQNFVFTNTTPTNPSGAVTAFPDEGTYAYTGVVDDYTSLTSTYSQSMPINSNTAAWAMQDDWLTEPGRPSGEDDYEVMVQYDFSNNGSCPGGTWPTTRYAEVATNVSLGGQLWHICDGQNAHNSDGSCPTTGNFCGQLVVKLGGTAANQPDSPSTSGTLNLKAIFQWLEDNDPPGSSYPYIEPGSSIAALSQGWEIASTGGVPEQFVGNGFTVDAAGGAAS
jgi:hypothetical protein